MLPGVEEDFDDAGHVARAVVVEDDATRAARPSL
jgi:hypothetical protein